MARSYPAEVLPLSSIVGESIHIETRKFKRARPRRYPHCEDSFYVINTQDNTTTKILIETANECMFLDENGDVQKPYYLLTTKNTHINGKKFIIESLDKNITNSDKYTIKKLTGTHQAQLLTTKSYTHCTMIQPHDNILRSQDYEKLLAIKEENKKASGPILIEDTN